MPTHCGGCNQPLVPGSRVFQLAAGDYMQSYITPTYRGWDAVVAEWHEQCFRDRITPQEEPYHCVICTELVADGSQVMYLTLGSKPSRGATRLESRGYSLPMIAHATCWLTASA